MSYSKDAQRGPSIAIIGAGAGGLGFAVHLKQKLGYENFTIYEKASEVGGTWRDNIYPGCSSDIPVGFYSLSTDSHDWKGSHAPQPEFLEYLCMVSSKHSIRPKIEFNQKVVNAVWNADSQMYTISLENTVTGERKEVSAKVVISAIGVLEVPRFADIPGLSSFKGELFHSARWNKDVVLKGKRVGVIGNGASATQFTPIITEDPSVKLTEFCRTPNWFLPPPRTIHSSFRRWAFRTLPFLHRLLRIWCFLISETLHLGVFTHSSLHNLTTKYSKNYILSTAPKEYHKYLIPTYPMGCKRIIFDTNYLESLHRPNFTLNWDGIDSIVEDGIVTKKGEKIPLDVLICSTGYVADFFPLPVRGTTQTIQEYFEEDGPKAYLGSAVPGFPNFFTIYGPNTTTGHTSVIYTNEIQARYIIQLIKPILEGEVSSVEVKEEAADAYNRKVDTRLKNSVHAQCNSWYRQGGDGRISGIFPGSPSTFYFWLRKPNWGHYTGIGLSSWRRQVKSRCQRSMVSFVALAVVLLFSVSYWCKSYPETASRLFDVVRRYMVSFLR